jgi:hypothetical protein
VPVAWTVNVAAAPVVTVASTGAVAIAGRATLGGADVPDADGTPWILPSTGPPPLHAASAPPATATTATVLPQVLFIALPSVGLAGGVLRVGGPWCRSIGASREGTAPRGCGCRRSLSKPQEALGEACGRPASRRGAICHALRERVWKAVYGLVGPYTLS